MSITKQTEVDQITVIENGAVQVRQATRIVDNGEKLSNSYHRWTIAPGQDYSDQELKVQAICAATHTPEVIEAYKAATAA
jgi:hypothetical protein